MTVAAFESVAFRFLRSDKPEVLALKGAWGVGKTFAWNRIFQLHRPEIKLDRYCYVSLFGISSLTELRTAICLKSVPINSAVPVRDLSSAKSRFRDLWTRAARFAHPGADLVRELPYGKAIQIGLDAIAPYLIENTIVCLDDFERMSADRIKPDELLGFISELKEEKRCKIVLIFNEDELATSKDTYKKYREKVVDIELLFSPTAGEAAGHAFPEGIEYRDLITTYSTSLDVKNVRVLRKIASLTSMVYEEVASLHPGVMERAVKTIVLLAWCYYESNETKPTYEFIRRRYRALFVVDAEIAEKNAQHVAWEELLNTYGLRFLTEFDDALQKVIERGYTEETGLAESARKLDTSIRADELDNSFSAAWDMFRNSFDDNKSDLVAALSGSLKSAVKYISPNNLSATTELLRQLNEGHLADGLIDYYVESRADEIELFNLRERPFADDITDHVVSERFGKHYAEARVLIPLDDVVKHVATNRPLQREHLDALENLTEDETYQLFKKVSGDALGRIVHGCLKCGEGSHQSMKEARERYARASSKADDPRVAAGLPVFRSLA